jgi:hypothetical protein
MLEDTIKALTAAVEANTKALLAGKTAAPAATTTKPAATTKPSEPEVSFEVLKATCNKVAKELGVPKAQKMILEVGGAAALANVKPGKYKALLAAAEAALTPAEPEPEEEETEL